MDFPSSRPWVNTVMPPLLWLILQPSSQRHSALKLANARSSGMVTVCPDMASYRGGGGRREKSGLVRLLSGPGGRHCEPGIWRQRREPTTYFFCGNNLSNSISSLQARSCCRLHRVLWWSACVCVCALREVQQPQSTLHKLIKQGGYKQRLTQVRALKT